MHYDKTQDVLICLATAGFLPSNFSDKRMKQPFHDFNGKSSNSKLRKLFTGLTDEVNLDDANVLILSRVEKNNA